MPKRDATTGVRIGAPRPSHSSTSPVPPVSLLRCVLSSRSVRVSPAPPAVRSPADSCARAGRDHLNFRL